MEISRPSSDKRVIHLAAGDSIPNRDFVLRWSVAGDETQFGVITNRESENGPGFLTLQMQPPAEPTDEQVTPREITFIMDVSGSMMGIPIEMSKQVVLRSLDKLRPDDRFNIVYFSGNNAQLWERAQLGSYENIPRGQGVPAESERGRRHRECSPVSSARCTRTTTRATCKCMYS